MSRLKIVMDKRIAAQDIELEDIALVARGKKDKKEKKDKRDGGESDQEETKKAHHE